MDQVEPAAAGFDRATTAEPFRRRECLRERGGQWCVHEVVSGAILLYVLRS